MATAEGWLYLACILDLFSRKIVGWAMAATMITALVTDALGMALCQHQPPAGLLHHSDRGCQDASLLYRTHLAAYKLTVSMSRTGNCYDNAVIESFWATLKTGRTADPRYRTRAEAQTDIFFSSKAFTIGSDDTLPWATLAQSNLNAIFNLGFNCLSIFSTEYQHLYWYCLSDDISFRLVIFGKVPLPGPLSLRIFTYGTQP